MKIDLKYIAENDAPKGIRLPKYIRRARGVAHLASICTQPKDEKHKCRGFDLGVAFFRNGETACILWRDYTLDEVKEIHTTDKYAKFVLRGEVWHGGQAQPVFARIVTTARAAKLAE